MTNKMSEGMSKGRTVINWIMIVAIIALILLIMAIIFGNLFDNVGFGSDSATVINDTITLSDTASTPSTVSGKTNIALSSIIVTNATGGEVVSSGNYTVSGGTFVAAATDYNGTSVNVSASATYDEQGKIDSNNIILNYTSSAVNTSKQLPTVGTIIGVALLLLILIGLLVFAITKLMGASGSIGSGAKSGSRFTGSAKTFS